MEDPAQLRFSVVVPAYNEEGFLAETLRSLRHQDYDGAYEIVVVDNNSTDATAEIAGSFGVRVVSELEPGVCQARQRGLSEARGEIVVSVDADTLYPPDWLSRIDRIVPVARGRRRGRWPVPLSRGPVVDRRVHHGAVRVGRHRLPGHRPARLRDRDQHRVPSGPRSTATT